MNVRAENELHISTPDEFEAAWLRWYNTDDELEQAELGFEVARNLPDLLKVVAGKHEALRQAAIANDALHRTIDEALKALPEDSRHDSLHENRVRAVLLGPHPWQAEEAAPIWFDEHAAAVLSSAAAALERVRLHNPGIDASAWLSRRAQHIRNGDIDT